MPAVRRPLTILAFGALALAAALVAVPSAFSDSSVWIRDPAGDVRPREPDAAPFVAGSDIRFVRATERSGQLSFRVVFGQMPPLASSEREQYVEWLSIAIWTNGKASGYASHFIELDANRQAVLRTSTSTRLRPASFSRKTVTVSLPTRLLGNPRVIRFSVTATRDGKSSSDDRAPDKRTLSLRLR